MDKYLSDNGRALLKNNLLVIGCYAGVSVIGFALYLVSWATNGSTLTLISVVSAVLVFIALFLIGYLVVKPLPKYKYLSAIGLALLLLVPAIVFALQGISEVTGGAVELYIFTAVIAPVLAFVSLGDVIALGPFLLITAAVPVLLIYSGIAARTIFKSSL